MGTYFPMSNNQSDPDPVTMRYLRDHLPDSNSEAPIFPSMIMYTNYSSSTDIHPVASNSGSSQQEILLNFGAGENQWKEGRRDNFLMGPNPGVLHGGSNLQGQGLSLSLGTNVTSVMQLSSIQYDNSDNQIFSPVLGHNGFMHGENEDDNCFQTKQTRDSDYVLSGVPSGSDVANEVVTYGKKIVVRGVTNSMYLKAAQQLLDEVVSVKREQNAKRELSKDSKEIEGELGSGGSDPSVGTKPSGGWSSDLSVAEKHELQNKVTKLFSMLDEVDRRYRQYYHQMQIVVSSFDVKTEPGSSRPYTSLALQTISRHFRSLRDAISAQILSARKGLGEDDASLNDKGVGISRLRYVDQQLRQQRALQQLRIMQQHAWRPQRGLPETSVSVLRAWLFEHFLHPYPKDSEKIMLARQAGLTRSQVSNWFINARVRLWKPMVEEMHKEEMGDADVDVDSNSSSEPIPRPEKTYNANDKGEDSQQATTSTGQQQLMESRSNQMTDLEIVRSDNNISVFQNGYVMGETREGRNSLFMDENPECGGSRFFSAAAAYHMSELEQFGNVNPVSLTLGLQQCEEESTNHGFNSLRDNVACGNTAPTMANEVVEFDCMDSGNRQHQFVSSLLPTFS